MIKDKQAKHLAKILSAYDPKKPKIAAESLTAQERRSIQSAIKTLQESK